jgi:hypothetical protein
MDRSSSLPPALAAAPVPAPITLRTLLTRGPPASSGQAPAHGDPAGLAEITLRLVEDHDRIAQGLNDVVIRRLFAAGLDLHTALGLVGDHCGAGRIRHAILELDHAIREIRDAIFDTGAPASSPVPMAATNAPASRTPRWRP